ncbi:MAG: glycosyltransferase family 39 protein, partial [Gemmataceae bacterium]|nr:glycosyltransferase family 39 protein [Gemmataceae bacterium]
EAHYWDWSRHLDWSYYSTGPLVAYLIRAGCALAGSWSVQLTANEMLAVRLPAVVCGSLLLVSLYFLTRQVYASERLATAVVAMALTLPLITAGASLMTIDAPYTCCWGWALVLGHQAIFRRAGWAWPATGLVVGLGILAKYTMVLWIPSVALFLLTSAEQRRLFFQRGFWSMTAIAAACCLPILLWNLHHDWVSVRHVGGQAGLRATSGIRWLGPLAYLGVQCALLLGFWFLAWAAAMVAHRPWKETNAGVRYLWWLSAPMFGIFWLFSLKTPEEPNWPVTAYLSGLVLAASWLVKQLRSGQLWYRWHTAASLVTACTVGLLLTLFVHRSQWLQPVLLRLSGPPSAERPLPLRRFDPTCRLRGWRVLAAEVDRVRGELHAEGIEPLLAGAAWTLPGELAFYCAGHPPVYSLGLALGDRHSQYDLWRPNPVHDPEAFAGRTFIFVGNASAALQLAFDQVEASQTVIHRERGQPIAQWTITVCRGFRGFPEMAAGAKVNRF